MGIQRNKNKKLMKHTLPKLTYDYDALEPYIDAKTMEVHYSKHHQAYTDKLNGVLEKYPALQEKNAEDILKEIDKLEVSDADRTAIRNNGGGYVNHSFFWTMMSPKKEVDQKLAEEVTATFGSFEEFKKLFSDTAASRFGSGWAWLARDAAGKLLVYSTGNQDSPLSLGQTPIVALDVWEHAYYLKYQNRRPEYIDNWWHVFKLL